MVNGERIKFGPFEADLRTCELFRRGASIPIQQKPFQLLAILLQRPGQLVTRTELHELLWPDTYVQKDLSLNTAVRKLRMALSDNDHSHRYIETVGSRGYRFSQRVPVSGLVRHHAQAPPARRVRLAVLPLENLSGPEHETFSDGITEQLIARLGRISEQVSVIAPVSSMQYKRTSKSATQICQELHCDHVLSGSVLRAATRVRVTAKLIRANDQTCVWTESFASDQSEILTIQDEIAEQIALALRSFLPRTGNHQASATPSHPEVLTKYLKATAFAAQAFNSGFENAARLLRETVEEEPDFALAHADLARLYANAATFGIMPPDELFRQVQVHARAALAISDNIESAHVALGHLNLYYEVNWEEAERCFRRAAAINPSCVWAYVGLSQVMTATGALKQGIETMRRAQELDPVSPIVATMLGCAYYFAGDHGNAEAVLKECLELHPGFPIALNSLAWVKLVTGNIDDAVSLAREARDRSGESPIISATYCVALAMAGEQRKARTLLSKLHAPGSDAFPFYWLALCHLALGDREKALDLLERCMEQRCAWRVLMLVDPMLKPLGGEARFRAMLHALHFPEAPAREH
jgi:TolB-like protein/Flp pilus assembly protein TadD